MAKTKDYVLQIRMTEADRKDLETFAATYRLSLSAWARMTLFWAIEREGWVGLTGRAPATPPKDVVAEARLPRRRAAKVRRS